MHFEQVDRRKLKISIETVRITLPEVSDMLPVMQYDITLSNGKCTLIIDAKNYAQNTKTQYDVPTVHDQQTAAC